MLIRDDRRRKVPTAIAVLSRPALLVLATAYIAKPSETVPARERFRGARR
jgi:hypothetical protein